MVAAPFRMSLRALRDRRRRRRDRLRLLSHAPVHGPLDDADRLALQLALRQTQERFGGRVIDANAGHLFTWVPVLFGCGAAGPFLFSRDLGLWPHIAVALVACGIWMTVRRGVYASLISVAAVALAAGFIAMGVRSWMVDAPVVSSQGRVVLVTGWIERVEDVVDPRRRKEAASKVGAVKETRHERLTLRVAAIGQTAEPDAARLPQRVRLRSNFGQSGLRIGQAVTVSAVLLPPGGPVRPGGYDFARAAFYKQLGAVGFAVAAPQPVSAARGPPPPPPPGLRLRAAMVIEDVRRAVGARIDGVLSGDVAGLARALIIGDRSALSPNAVRAFRQSGLAHLLAISGLHMAVMAGSLFWGLRLGFALVPPLLLRVRVDRVAAAIALVGAFGYLLLSGASISTQRAFVMVALMFLAVIAGRRAVSMHNVAVAALVILIVRPESIFDIGFQMSFAAVIGLVCVYEALSERRERRRLEGRYVPPPLRWFAWPFQVVGGVALTTVIASVAVAPVSLYHFQTLAQFGVVANIFAVPVVTLVVMPLALLSLAAMSVGLEAPVLQVMAYSLDAVLQVSDFVSGLDGAVMRVAQMPVGSFVALCAGCLWLALWRGGIRWLGVTFMGLALWIAYAPERPDIMIAQEGRAIAVRLDDGRLAVPWARRGRYAVRRWLASLGQDDSDAAVAALARLACDPDGCAAVVKGRLIAIARHPRGLRADCRRADVVIALFDHAGGCQKARLFLDAHRLKSHGAHAIYLPDASSAPLSDTGEASRPWLLQRAVARLSGRAHSDGATQIRVERASEWRGQRRWTRAPHVVRDH